MKRQKKKYVIIGAGAVAVLAACLLYTSKAAEEGVAITVFFDEDATESQIEEIGKELRSRDDVLKVEYVSEDDAWNSFKEEYFGDNPELADGFKDDNPLAGSSSYAVYMKPQEDKDSNMISKSKSLSATQKELVKFAEGLDGVRKVNKSDVVANTLSSVNAVSYTHLKGRWRIPEKTLLLFAAAGGSPGALAGMFVFHHKIRKPLFYLGVPLILLLQIGVGLWNWQR